MKQRGFTLIELITVVAMISFLSVIAFIQFGNLRDKARITRARAFETQVHNAIGDRLVAEWLFEGDAKDTSGSGYDGVLEGGASIETDCISGSCVSFNGNADRVYIDMSLKPLNFPDDQISFMFWIKSNQTYRKWYQLLSANYPIFAMRNYVSGFMEARFFWNYSVWHTTD